MVRTHICVSLLIALAGLSGCGASRESTVAPTTTAATAPKATGVVHGANYPVSGAVIQLWAVGTTGYGSAATPLIGATLTTSDGTGTVNSNANAGNQNNALPSGSFTITGDYTCPSASTLVYLTATGGNPGLAGTVNNSALVLLAALGQCGSLTSSTYVVINEVTTVGSVFALAPFIGSGGSIGSASDSASLQAIANAFASLGNLVNITTGTVLTTTSGGNTVPQAKLNTLANILVACVNSTGPTSTACAALFSAATPSGGTAPTTVLGAIVDIALNPNNNVTALYNVAVADSAFQPTVTSAPAVWSILTGGGATPPCGGSNSGDTISGTVSYSGTKTGRIYLALVSNSGCNGQGTQGTSISAPGAYTIRGATPGISYTLSAFMDTLGTGGLNAANPTGGIVFAANAVNLSGVNVTLADPGTVTVTTAPTITGVNPFNTGFIAQFNPAVNSSGTETPTTYTLQWSTTSTFASVAGSKTFPAMGTNSNLGGIVFVNGLTNGNIYYFRAYGTSAGTPVGPYSTVYGPVTIGAPASGSTVSGSISFTGAATGPMYAGFYNPYLKSTVYLDYIPSPGSLQAYSVAVPNSTSPAYIPVAIIDQNNNGIIDPGDIEDVQTGLQGAPIAVTGATANVNQTLPSTSYAALAPSATFLSGTTKTYSITLYVNWLGKLPVSVTVLPSSNPDGANVVGPMDIASCSVPGNTNCSGFGITFNLGATVPTAGDTYLLNVKFSDGTSSTVAVPVTAVLNTFATNLAPTTGTSTTPTFTWIAPVCGACNTYNYEFNLNSPTANIWYVPGNTNGLPYTTTSLAWGIDPTDSSNTPSVSSLTLGTLYNWSITVQDPYYNSATTTVNYQP
jgi:hypothetical protein